MNIEINFEMNIWMNIERVLNWILKLISEWILKWILKWILEWILKWIFNVEWVIIMLFVSNNNLDINFCLTTFFLQLLRIHSAHIFDNFWSYNLKNWQILNFQKLKNKSYKLFIQFSHFLFFNSGPWMRKI